MRIPASYTKWWIKQGTSKGLARFKLGSSQKKVFKYTIQTTIIPKTTITFWVIPKRWLGTILNICERELQIPHPKSPSKKTIPNTKYTILKAKHIDWALAKRWLATILNSWKWELHAAAHQIPNGRPLPAHNCTNQNWLLLKHFQFLHPPNLSRRCKSTHSPT